MTRHRIEGVTVAERSRAATRDFDRWFVAVHAADDTGWYGPVRESVAAYVGRVFKNIRGPDITDHDGLMRLLLDATEEVTAVGSWAAGAVDCAAWDLHGRVAGLPVARLLSNEPRTEVPLYASWLGFDPLQDGADAVARQVQSTGWDFLKWNLARQPTLDASDEPTRLRDVIRRIEAYLDEPCAFDALGTWDRSLAIAALREVDLRSVLWIEDPLPTRHAEAYASWAGCIPLALGEKLRLDDGIGPFLRLGLTALTLDVVGCGGITRAIPLAQEAARAGVTTYPHGQSFMPGLHLASALPDAVASVEYRLQWEPQRQVSYRDPVVPRGGKAELPRRPGLGTAPYLP